MITRKTSYFEFNKLLNSAIENSDLDNYILNLSKFIKSSSQHYLGNLFLARAYNIKGDKSRAFQQYKLAIEVFKSGRSKRASEILLEEFEGFLKQNKIFKKDRIGLQILKLKKIIEEFNF